jgi:serine/threonine protein kinase
MEISESRTIDSIRIFLTNADYSKSPISKETAFKIVDFLEENMNSSIAIKSAPRKNTFKLKSPSITEYKIFFNPITCEISLKIAHIEDGSVKKVWKFFILNNFTCEAISKQKLANKQDVYTTDREIKILTLLKGVPHTLQILWHGLYDSKNISKRILSTEFCKLGDLQTYTIITYVNKYVIADKILKAIHYLHNLDILHRDIKPENIFLKSERDPVLADFGLACFGDNLTDINTPCGSIPYVAPEILLGQPATKASDAWSAGVTFYKMFNDDRPYPQLDDEQETFIEIKKYLSGANEAPLHKNSEDFVIWSLLRPSHERMTISKASENFDRFVTNLGI